MSAAACLRWSSCRGAASEFGDQWSQGGGAGSVGQDDLVAVGDGMVGDRLGHRAGANESDNHFGSPLVRMTVPRLVGETAWVIAAW
jgi:hypothetical protein